MRRVEFQIADLKEKATRDILIVSDHDGKQRCWTKFEKEGQLCIVKILVNLIASFKTIKSTLKNF